MKQVLMITLWVALSFTAFLNQEAWAAEEKKDNSGTNPANFTYDFRLITEYQNLPDSDNSTIINTVELRWPLGRNAAYLLGKDEESMFHKLGKIFALSVKIPTTHLSLETPAGTTFNRSGLSDINARLLGLFYGSRTLIVAGGIEAFFDTAADESLGSGKTSLGPQVFFVFPGILGAKSLFAPAYQFVFDIAGDDDRSDIRRSLIDLYFVWMLAGGRNWLIVDPQIVVDHENEIEFMNVETEWGFMMGPGYSAYLRPGFGVGSDRAYDGNIEAGLKFIWR